MDSDKSVSARFTASVNTYNKHANVQEKVAGKVIELLDGVTIPQKILETGCGTGILTEKLQKTLFNTKIHALDISREMIEKAKEQVLDNKSISWIVNDICDYIPKNPYGLVVSSSSLHWINPIKHAFRKISSVLNKKGYLVFGMMINGTLAELHESRNMVVQNKATHVHLPDEKTILSALHESNFNLIKTDRESIKDEFPSAKKFLTSIHQMGVTGGGVSHSGSLLTRTEIGKMLCYYDEHFRTDNDMVRATYEMFYVVAQKKE